MHNSHENGKILTMQTVNPRVIEVEYAIRGPIAIRAAEIEEQIKQVLLLLLLLITIFFHKGNHKFPFDRLIRANIGDCHASRSQIPITYIRQVCIYIYFLTKTKIFLNSLSLVVLIRQ
jgi:alanine transaminase